MVFFLDFLIFSYFFYQSIPITGFQALFIFHPIHLAFEMLPCNFDKIGRNVGNLCLKTWNSSFSSINFSSIHDQMFILHDQMTFFTIKLHSSWSSDMQAKRMTATMMSTLGILEDTIAARVTSFPSSTEYSSTGTTLIVAVGTAKDILIDQDHMCDHWVVSCSADYIYFSPKTKKVVNLNHWMLKESIFTYFLVLETQIKNEYIILASFFHKNILSLIKQST